MTTATLPTTALAGAGASVATGKAGATGATGQLTYFDTATRTYKLAQADAEATAMLAGVYLNTSEVIGSPVDLIKGGILGGLSSLTAGQTYCLSETVAGDVMLESDITSTNYMSTLGIAISTTEIQLGINNSGVAHA